MHKVGRSGSKMSIAKEIAEMHYRDGKVYRLDAYCIMANHVHVVFAPLAIQSSGEAQTNSLRYLWYIGICFYLLRADNISLLHKLVCVMK